MCGGSISSMTDTPTSNRIFFFWRESSCSHPSGKYTSELRPAVSGTHVHSCSNNNVIFYNCIQEVFRSIGDGLFRYVATIDDISEVVECADLPNCLL